MLINLTADIQYFTARIPRYERKYGYTDTKRTYHVAKDVPTLAMIDRPKKKGLHDLVAHQSEGGWVLPRDHRRHFLNFPQGELLLDPLPLDGSALINFITEIIDMIFRNVLTINNHTITPDVTTSNWARAFKCHQNYSLDGVKSTKSELSLNTIVAQARQDRQGNYFELRKVYRPRIDAALLRVCKSFRDSATTMLYAENVFQFPTMDWSETGSPGSWVDGKAEEDQIRGRHMLLELPSVIINPDNWPFGGTQPDSFAVKDAIRFINTPSTPKLENCLLSYTYHDHFFRFLHAIGKEKAGTLKNLSLSGRVVLHRCTGTDLCHGSGTLPCRKDLIDTLRLYIPIINKFCTGLEKLVIEVEEDPHAQLLELFAMDVSGSLEDIFRKSVSSLLEGELRNLKTVKILEVMKVESVIPAGSIENHLHKRQVIKKKLDLAEPTIAWFKERANRLTR